MAVRSAFSTVGGIGNVSDGACSLRKAAWPAVNDMLGRYDTECEEWPDVW